MGVLKIGSDGGRTFGQSFRQWTHLVEVLVPTHELLDEHMHAEVHALMREEEALSDEVVCLLQLHPATRLLSFWWGNQERLLKQAWIERGKARSEWVALSLVVAVCDWYSRMEEVGRVTLTMEEVDRHIGIGYMLDMWRDIIPQNTVCELWLGILLVFTLYVPLFVKSQADK